MGRAIAAAISGSAAALPFRMPSALSGFWHDFIRDLFNDYRPERHYMRGPGPAWRKKNGISG
jgi:hypothetical protein